MKREKPQSFENKAAKTTNTFPAVLIAISVAVLMGWHFLLSEIQVHDFGNNPQPNVNVMPPLIVLDTFPDGNKTAPGQIQIKVNSADEVNLPEDTPIIGVVIDGQSRAYLPKGMSEPQWHLAHDNFNGRPITVTYCNWTDCARVFTRGSVPPGQVHMGGFLNGQMQLLIKNTPYDQNGTQLPIAHYPMKRATWGKWKATHPETEIYLGDQAPKE